MRFRTVARVASRAIEVRIRDLLGLPLRPYKALLDLISTCNSRCTTCDIWKTPSSITKTDLTLPEIESFLTGFGRDLVWLALSGGEVTLVKHFPAVIEAARGLCPNLALVTFTTNGLLPETALAYAKCVADQGFDLFVTVSLDGDESVHDRIRGVAGNFALATRTLELLEREGIPAHFGITLGDGNRGFVRDRFNGVREKFKAVTFVASGGIYHRQNTVDDSGILESIREVLRGYSISGPGELIEWIYLRLALIFFAGRRQHLPLPCDVLRTSVHVKPNGEVTPCMFLQPVGNVRQQGFQDIMRSQSTRTAVKEIDAGRCPRCWMNCYAPHSILHRPFASLLRAIAPRT